MAFGSNESGIIAIAESRLPSSSPLKCCSFASPSPSQSPSPSAEAVCSHSSSNRERGVISANGKGWLEAMYASSPPHSRSSLRIDPFDKGIIDPDLLYRLWTLRHPSALTCFDRITEEASGKQVVVFLDYDGTLSPIVENPDRAFMSDTMRATVKKVAMHFPVAIISGRCRDKVYDFVQLPELYYAGSHGMDIMGPALSCHGVKAQGSRDMDVKGNKVVLFQPANDLPRMIEEICRELKEKTRAVDGVRIENNKFCAAVHFRCVKEGDWHTLAEYVEEVVQFYPNLCVTQGRKVLEIRPTIAWNKGKALLFLLNTLGLGCCNDVFPVYIGDDQTDEDAFRALNEKGQGHGISILVSSIAKRTAANWSLRDPCEVMKVIINCRKEGIKSDEKKENLLHFQLALLKITRILPVFVVEPKLEKQYWLHKLVRKTFFV